MKKLSKEISQLLLTIAPNCISNIVFEITFRASILVEEFDIYKTVKIYHDEY